MAAPSMTYGNYSFDPVPLYTWTTETAYDGAGDRIVLRHTCDFTGILYNTAGDSDITEMISRRDSLKDALASGFQEFIIVQDGTSLVSGVYPKISNLSFEEGTWVDRINYSFNMVYEEDFYNTGVQSYSESWSFEESDDRRSATCSHTLSAMGLNTATSGNSNSAFQNAKTFVLSRTGYSNLISGAYAFVAPSGTVSAYEELRSEQVDVQGGNFSVSEQFILSSGNAIHTSTSQLELDDDGVYTVSIDGTIRGLGRGDTSYPRALTKWGSVEGLLPSVASGVYNELGGTATLYTTNFQSFSVTRNTFAGEIGYSVSYTDSSAENLPSGILEFSFNVQDTKPVRLYASFPIMERALGNVIQDIATSTEGTYSISGNSACKQDYDYDDLVAYVEDKINEKKPSSVSYQTLRLTSQSVTKDEDNKTVNWNLVWTYTVELSQAAIDGNVTL